MIHGFLSRLPINKIHVVKLAILLVWVVKVQVTRDKIKRISFKDFSRLYTVPRRKSLCDPQYATLNTASEAFHATYSWNRQTNGCSVVQSLLKAENRRSNNKSETNWTQFIERPTLKCHHWYALIAPIIFSFAAKTGFPLCLLYNCPWH